jgi:Holliday junction resolvasome RuvABC endonuclease subunit
MAFLLCLDPSKKATGYAVYCSTSESIVEHGLVTPKGQIHECWDLTSQVLNDLVAKYQVAGIVSEDPGFSNTRGFGSSSDKTLMAYTYLVSLIESRNSLLKTIWLAPTSLKLLWTGSGKAEKSDMMAKVEQTFGFEVQDDNDADACSIAGVLKEKTYLGLIDYLNAKKEEKQNARRRRKAKTRVCVNGPEEAKGNRKQRRKDGPPERDRS